MVPRLRGEDNNSFCIINKHKNYKGIPQPSPALGVRVGSSLYEVFEPVEAKRILDKPN